MRLPKLTDLSPRQQEISDRITSRRGGTRGPFLVSLRSPELCEKVEALGAFCRFESSLDPRLRELSLLIAARHWDAQYSWNAHVGKAADLGVSRESLTALAEHREPHFTSKDEDIVYRFSSVDDRGQREEAARGGDQAHHQQGDLREVVLGVQPAEHSEEQPFARRVVRHPRPAEQASEHRGHRRHQDERGDRIRGGAPPVVGDGQRGHRGGMRHLLPRQNPEDADVHGQVEGP